MAMEHILRYSKNAVEKRPCYEQRFSSSKQPQNATWKKRVAKSLHECARQLQRPFEWVANAYFKYQQKLKMAKVKRSSPSFGKQLLWKLKMCLAGTLVFLCFPLYLLGKAALKTSYFFNRDRMILSTHPKAKPHHRSKKAFHFLSMNTALLPPLYSILTYLQHPKKRAKKLADKLSQSQAHVICLQEFFFPPAKRTILQALSQHYPYILSDIASQSLGLDSGLLIASQHPIKEVKFIQFPKHYFAPTTSLPGIAINPEAFANKGVCYALIETKPGQYDLFLNAHTPSKLGDNPRTQEFYKKYRHECHKIIVQGLMDYQHALEERGIHVNRAFLGADLNTSDKYDDDPSIWTWERTAPHKSSKMPKPCKEAQKNWIGTDEKSEKKTARFDNSFLFEGAFPGKDRDTWIEQVIQERCNTRQKQHHVSRVKYITPKQLRFDHIGMMQMSAPKKAKLVKSHMPEKDTLEYFNTKVTVERFPKHSPYTPPVSDHLGLKMTLVNRKNRRG